MDLAHHRDPEREKREKKGSADGEKTGEKKKRESSSKRLARFAVTVAFAKAVASARGKKQKQKKPVDLKEALQVCRDKTFSLQPVVSPATDTHSRGCDCDW